MLDASERELTEDDIRALEHDFIGPTWARDEFGNWILPQHTLGWQIARWCSKYMLAEAGGPWKFTLEQLRFVLWWYAVDETGRFVYRTGVLQRMKGWGKDPLLAVLCLVELCGPSRVKITPFGPEFGKDGHPVGEAHPQAYVQVTAVNQSQTGNTMDLIPSLISDDMKVKFNITDGQEVIRADGGRKKLVAVTSSYRALEGKRTTFTLLNETHHWVSGNNGHKMYETIDGNATKKDSRYLAITNAYLPGEDSVAERMRDSWQKVQDGRAVDVGMLYDSVEAHPLTPLTPEALRIVLPIIRGDAVWLNPETIIQSIQNTTIHASRSRRMWLNQVVAEEDALLGPAEWKSIEKPDALLKAGDKIVLGFDGGKTDDSTVLVALRVNDKVAFVLHIQECPDGPMGESWVVNRIRVDEAVHEAFRLYDVQAFYADVALWESYIDDWAEVYADRLGALASEKHAIAWDMRGSQQRVTRAHERFLQAIFDQKTFHDGNPDLRRHALNARRHTNIYGVSFRKETPESKKKVDAYAAYMLAHEALHDLRTRKRKPEKKRTGVVMFY